MPFDYLGPLFGFLLHAVETESKHQDRCEHHHKGGGPEYADAVCHNALLAAGFSAQDDRGSKIRKLDNMQLGSPCP